MFLEKPNFINLLFNNNNNNNNNNFSYLNYYKYQTQYV
jgi:hypothetical protein